MVNKNMENNDYPLLEYLSEPSDIQKLTIAQKYMLAREVRARIIEVTSRNGGHLASSLGTVELAIALLSSMDISNGDDKVIWDVGHQAYPWKILTGRHHSFDTLRRYGGISGFLRIQESEYDHFGAGHASTSISASVGMSLAHKYMGKESHICAVIGDGALTGGLALEALNNIGYLGAKVIIILNDNKFSISGNVGSLSRFISRSLSKRTMRQIKTGIKHIAGESRFVEYLRKSERTLKSLVTPGMLFEAFHLNYIGPIHGHDIFSLEEHIEVAKQQKRPVLLHIYTEKGKGCIPAERDPIKFHGVGQFTFSENEVIFATKPSHIPTYTNVFSHTLCSLARTDNRIVAITAAMPEGTGLSIFYEEFKDRCIDVGICEGHAVTMASGLAKEGMIPVVAIYSTFLQRAYDNIIHDVCIQNLPVIFCIDRAGFVGEDGATHHGVFDIAYLRIIPNMIVIVPSDENELQHALYTATEYKCPVAIRYPKGTATGCTLDTELVHIPIGCGRYIQQGEKVAIICIGPIVWDVVEAVKKIQEEYRVQITIFDARFVKPLSVQELCCIAKTHDIILSFEEGIRAGGFGSAVLELYSDYGCIPRIYRYYGIPDSFIEHGTRKELLSEVDLDIKGIYNIIKEVLEEQTEE